MWTSLIRVKNFLAGIVTLAIVSNREIWLCENYAQRLLVGILVYIALIILADWVSRFRKLDKKIQKRVERRRNHDRQRSN